MTLVDPDPSRARILVVDDEESVIRDLVSLLDRGGYGNVLATRDPSAVASLVGTFEPDLILLDLHMPDLDGLGVLAELTRAFGDDVVPVVMLTAHGSDAAKLRALSGGAWDFLTKPVHAAELMLRVRNLLTVRMQHRALVEHNVVLADRLAAQDDATRAREERRRAITLRTEALLDEGGPTMVFQPIVALGSGDLAGVEALARFPDDVERGPAQWFMEAAEVGLGVQLELAAMTAALEHLDALPDDAFLAINLTPETLCSRAGQAVVAGAPAGRLVVELTEHGQLGGDDVAKTFTALRELGVRFAVDDVGTGFASLHHIAELRPDLIKLDRNLIAAIDRDPVRRALVAALRRFATETSCRLIAEGIEIIDELEALRDLGVELGQGYLLARPGDLPVPAAGYNDLLAGF